MGIIKNKFIKDTGIMFFASILASICNLLYQLCMVRMLSPIDFGTLNALMSLLLVASMPTGPLQTVTAKFVANYRAVNDEYSVHCLLCHFLKIVSIVSVIALFSLTIFSSKIASILQIDSNGSVIVVGVIVALSIIWPVPLGGLQGTQNQRVIP